MDGCMLPSTPQLTPYPPFTPKQVTVIHPQLSVEEKTPDIMDSSPPTNHSPLSSPLLPARPPHGQHSPSGGPLPHHNPPPAPAHARVSVQNVEVKPHQVVRNMMEGAAVNTAGM